MINTHNKSMFSIVCVYVFMYAHIIKNLTMYRKKLNTL